MRRLNEQNISRLWRHRPISKRVRRAGEKLYYMLLCTLLLLVENIFKTFGLAQIGCLQTQLYMIKYTQQLRVVALAMRRWKLCAGYQLFRVEIGIAARTRMSSGSLVNFEFKENYQPLKGQVGCQTHEHAQTHASISSLLVCLQLFCQCFTMY